MIVFRETMDSHSLDVVRDPNPDNRFEWSRIVARSGILANRQRWFRWATQPASRWPRWSR